MSCFINIGHNWLTILNNVDLVIIKFFTHLSSSYSVNIHQKNHLVLLGFTQCLNSYDRIRKQLCNGKWWSVTVVRKNFVFVSAMGFRLLKFRSKDEGQNNLNFFSMIETTTYTLLKIKPYPLICPWNRKNGRWGLIYVVDAQN